MGSRRRGSNLDRRRGEGIRIHRRMVSAGSVLPSTPRPRLTVLPPGYVVPYEVGPPQRHEKPLLAIVTATYNRRSSLQRMVASARSALAPGTPYELIVVDGGSDDGTQEWVYGQPDMRLLDGDLTGAVANFNRGFAAVGAPYVIMANDDIEFVGPSLQNALDFMRHNPRCGAGCIPQVRVEGEAPWVMAMRVNVGGAVVRQWPMAQVAIVPTVLGDAWGWWGTATAHYHGDEYLSRRIWEEGFTCSVVPEAWIHDHRVSDGLRRRNTRLGRSRQDEAAFRRMFTATPQVAYKPTLSVAVPPAAHDVDVVLGTYNRLPYLQRCLESYRQAAAGLRLRFVVVDGGSTDGTVEWLASQLDVSLVRGGLTGAVRAFNVGFSRTTAPYVANANDDMAVSGSLQAAVAYLNEHPGVGQLAFPKADAGGASRTQTALGKVFANFGLTRRWLGAYVGWWGTATHKYFGDVHCSLCIWELGYSVEEYGGVTAIDYLVEDDLRGARGGDAQCEADSKLFESSWDRRERGRSYVHVPSQPLVGRADFE